MKVSSDELFHVCNNKLQTSHYRDYCLADTCAYTAAPVNHSRFTSIVLSLSDSLI